MGPLQGLTIIEIAGIGPGPFAAMSLADLGADVIRVERPGGGMFTATHNTKLDFLNRGKRCICVNLKSPEGVDTVLRLVEKADAALAAVQEIQFGIVGTLNTLTTSWAIDRDYPIFDKLEEARLLFENLICKDN